MDKKKVLEIQSKNKNYEYEENIILKSNRIGLIVAALFIMLFAVIDLINIGEIDYKPLIVLNAVNFAMNLYVFIKNKEKSRLFAAIVWFLVFLLFLVRYILR